MFLTARLYLSAAMGWPVASVLVGPVPADHSDRVLSVHARTLVAQTSHGASFPSVPCAVSVQDYSVTVLSIQLK